MNAPNGQLIPQGGGENIPLERERLVLGRRESCDVCLPFPNVSGTHCELVFKSGSWVVQDLNSTNGIKVNGTRVEKKVLMPGDTLMIGKRDYVLEYVQSGDARELAEFSDEAEDMSRSLMEKAGLERPRKKK